VTIVPATYPPLPPPSLTVRVGDPAAVVSVRALAPLNEKSPAVFFAPGTGELCGNQTHFEEKHEGIVINCAINLLRSHNAEGNHEHRPKQRLCRTIQRENFQPPAADQQVGESENRDRDDLLLRRGSVFPLQATARVGRRR